ncbi:MAG: hypothetical protein AMXMBFR53_13860 [Gemmatimonadota bacterium]
MVKVRSRHVMAITIVPLLALFVSCDGVHQITRVEDPQSPASMTPTAPSNAALAQVARALALAVADEGTRLLVRDAMRASPWGRHVLDVHAFLGSDESGGIRTEVQRAAGLSPAAFDSMLAQLPSLDLFLASAAVRTSWRGGGEIMVYAALDPQVTPAYVFDARGGSVRDARASQAVLVIAPARQRIERYDLTEAEPGVIESKNTVTIAYELRGADGSLVRTTFAELMRENPKGDGPLAVGSNGDTKLSWIDINFCDGPAGDIEFGPAQIRLQVSFYDASNTFVGSQTTTHDAGTPSNGDCDPNVGSYVRTYFATQPTLLPWVMPAGAQHRLEFAMWEQDTFSGDDYVGAATLYPNQGTQVSFGSGSCPTASSRCGRLGFTVPSISASTLTSVSLPPVSMTEGLTPASPTAKAFDQYGFGLLATPTNWGTSDSNIATVEPLSGPGAFVYGHNDGQTTYFATVNGVYTSNTATVYPCSPPDCFEQRRTQVRTKLGAGSR